MVKDVIIKFANSGLVRQAGVYIFSSILGSLIPFFLLPILTRYLSTQDYGYMSIFLSFSGFLFPIILLSLNGSITREFFRDDKLDYAHYLGTLVTVICVNFVLFLSIALLFSKVLGLWLELPSEWIWAIPVAAFGQALSLMILTHFQIHKKKWLYATFHILQNFINALLCLLLVISFKFNWEARVWGVVCSYLFVVIIGFIYLKNKHAINFKVKREYAIRALLYGLPLLPQTAGSWIINQADRIFITKMVSVSDAGLYAAGIQVAAIIGFIELGLNYAWGPWFLEKMKENSQEVKEKVLRYTYIYFFAIGLMTFVFILLIPWLMSFIVGKDFYSASVFIFWFALARAVEALWYMATHYIIWVGKTAYMGFISLAVACIHIPLLYFFIKYNGALGAAQASFVSAFLLAVLTWGAAMRLVKMPRIPWRVK